MDRKLYLARFQAPSSLDASLSYLTELQQLHLWNIPFENLDVIRKTPIYLNLKYIYKKVVLNNRGGYCYELNGLFHWLLSELGFDAHLIAATVKRPNGQWAKANTHAAILVNLDAPYLVDTGFGAATPRSPIPLDGSERTDVNGTYKAVRQTGQTFDLSYESETGTRTLYRFNTEKKKLVDFHEGCVFNQVSKESTFTHSDIVTRATPTGQITLTDRTLTIVENGRLTKTEFAEEQKGQILQDIFQIHL